MLSQLNTGLAQKLTFDPAEQSCPGFSWHFLSSLKVRASDYFLINTGYLTFVNPGSWMEKESLITKVFSEFLFQITKTVIAKFQRNSELIKRLFIDFCQYLWQLLFIFSSLFYIQKWDSLGNIKLRSPAWESSLRSAFSGVYGMWFIHLSLRNGSQWGIHRRVSPQVCSCPRGNRLSSWSA